MNRFGVLMLAAIAGMAAGCVTSAPVRGSVTSPTVGNPMMDFTFIDDRGSPRSLREITGDFTILAFTHCDKDTHQPAVETLSAMVRDGRTAPFIRVVGVDIHRPSSAVDRDGRCHLIQAHRDVASICDGTGAVSQLYGVGTEDWLVMIDPNGFVNFSGSMQSVDRLRAELDRDIARYRPTKIRGHGVYPSHTDANRRF